MKNFNYVKDTIVRDTNTPVLMMCYFKDEKPDLLIPIAGDIWVCEFDEFFDAGLDEKVSIYPICGHECKPRTDERIAFNYFMEGADSGEYGESMRPFEEEHRRQHFAALYKFKTGNELVFKLKEVG